MKLHRLLVLLILLTFSATAPAGEKNRLPKQFMSEFKEQLCLDKKGNPKLRDLKLGETLDFFDGKSKTGYTELSSSFLPPSRKAPVYDAYLPDSCVPPNDFECDPAPVVFSSQYARWSCMHTVTAVLAPVSRLDFTPAETWAEGVEGDGIGEVIVVPLEERMVIWAGNAKSEALFKMNNRPQEIRVFVMQGVSNGYTGTNGAKDITVIAEHYVTLKDHYGYQPLPVPDYTSSALYQLNRQRFVGIEIRSVYKGTKWQDTCISHIFGLHPISKEIPDAAFQGGYKAAVYKRRE